MDSTYHSIPDWDRRYSVNSDGAVYSHLSNKVLKQSINNSGYPVVTLNDDLAGRTKTIPVHRIVAETFLGIPAGREVCHIDGNPLNNRLTNLRVDTHKSNGEDMSKHGTAGRKTKLTASDVAAIRASDKTDSELGLQFGISANYAYMIKTGRRLVTR